MCVSTLRVVTKDVSEIFGNIFRSCNSFYLIHQKGNIISEIKFRNNPSITEPNITSITIIDLCSSSYRIYSKRHATTLYATIAKRKQKVALSPILCTFMYFMRILCFMYLCDIYAICMCPSVVSFTIVNDS